MLELILGTVRIDPSSFLNKYIGGQGGSPLLAANVIVPDMTPLEGSPYGMGNKRIDNPDLPDKFPQYGEDAFFLDRPNSGMPAGYKAVGSFGEFKTEKERQDALNDEYRPRYSPRQGGMIRGYMDFVPGGIPAAEGFNYDASLKAFPQQMQGVPRGNMPAYRYREYSR